MAFVVLILVVLLQRGHQEFGVGPFGADPRNGRDIVDWVESDYELVDRLGPPPFRGQGCGAEIWRRLPSAQGRRDENHP